MTPERRCRSPRRRNRLGAPPTLGSGKVLCLLANRRLSATYHLDGNVLTVRRVVDDTTPTNTCTPAQMADFKKQARVIAKDVAAQVLFQW